MDIFCKKKSFFAYGVVSNNKIYKIKYISADLGPERGVNQDSTFTPVSNYLKQKNFYLIDYFYFI